MSSIRPYDISESVGIGKMLPSQREFIFNPARYKFIAGGYRGGKSRAMCTAGLILSAMIPGNVGAFLCYRGTDAEARLKPILDEIIPESWLKAYHKLTRTYVLRNNSIIMIRHLHDSGSGTNAAAKTRRIGMNLGFFGIDQIEECGIEHWNAMISRLSLARAPKKFAFATLNPNGHDWIWEKAFQGMQPWPKDEAGRALPLDGKFYQVMHPEKDVIGIAVNAEENRVSNGGFIEDRYFDALLDQYDDKLRDRYVYSSFDEFKGKILSEYSAGLTNDNDASVHNIVPFQIPAHWDCIVGIDVGGESPWAVVPAFIDEYGNLIITPAFHGRTGRTLDIVQWIKGTVPFQSNRCTFVIDPENTIAGVELLDAGIPTRKAQKALLPGILRMNAFFHVQKGRELPRWYLETQPQHKIEKFKRLGSPSIFVFNNDGYTRRELDTAKWDPNKVDVMFKSSTARWDTVEALRYMCMERVLPSRPDPGEDKYSKMERMDPMSAAEERARDARIKAWTDAQKGGLRDMEVDEQPATMASANYDFAVKEEW